MDTAAAAASRGPARRRSRPLLCVAVLAAHGAPKVGMGLPRMAATNAADRDDSLPNVRLGVAALDGLHVLLVAPFLVRPADQEVLVEPP